MTRLAKSIAILVAILILLPVALILLTISALQFPAGRQAVSSFVSNIASTDDLEIKLEGLYLSFGLDAGLDRLIMADRQGVFLSADQVSLDWSPLALFKGAVKVNKADVASLSVVRQPVLPASTEDTPDDSDDETGGGLPALSGQVDTLSIGSLTLGESLLGEPIELSVNGGATLDPSPLTLAGTLEIFRKDTPEQTGEAGGRIAADVRFAPEAKTLAFDLTVQEPQGGIAARLLEVPGLPALDVRLKGDGPLSDWAADLAVALDGRETVKGTARLSEADQGYLFNTDLEGDLSPLMPEMVSAFFLGATDLQGSASLSQDFLPLDGKLTLTTDTLNVAANGSFAPDTQNLSAEAAINVAAGNDNLIALEVGDRQVRFGPLALNAHVLGRLDRADWSVKLNGKQLATTEGAVGELDLTAEGKRADFSADVLETPVNLVLQFTGVEATEPVLEPLAGETRVTLAGQANAKAKSLKISKAQVQLPSGVLEVTDSLLSQEELKLALTAAFDDLTAYAGLAGRPLSGGLQLAVNANGAPSTMTFDGSLKGTGTGLAIGQAQADALLSGAMTLDGRFKMAGLEDLSLSGLSLQTQGLDISGSAGLNGDQVSAELNGQVNELALVNPQVIGPLAFKASASGPLTGADVDLELSSKQITLAGTNLDNLAASITAVASMEAPSASISITGRLEDQPIDVSANLTSQDGGAVLDDLEADIVGNKISGGFTLADLTKAPEGLEGSLTIDAPDLSTLSPLALRPLSGSLTGDIQISGDDAQTKGVDIALSGEDLAVETLSIGSLLVNAKVADPFTAPAIDADVTARTIQAGSAPFESLTLNASSTGKTTQFTSKLALDAGDDPDGLAVEGTLSLEDDGSATLQLAKLGGRYQGINTHLNQETRITHSGGKTEIEPLSMSLGDGSLTVSGTVDTALDVKADLKDVPLTLANAFAPDLDLSGTLTGSASVSGETSSPEVSWKAGIADLSAAPLKSNGLSALGVDSQGKLEGETITQTTKVYGADSLVLTTSGSVSMGAPQTLDLSIDGSLPLSYLRRPLTLAGLRAEGAVSLSGKVGGTTTAPDYALSASPQNVELTDLNTATTLKNFQGSFDVAPSGVSISNFTADIAAGGSISANGTISLDEGNTADLTVKAIDARYVDPGLVNALTNAEISINGPLTSTTSAAQVTGKITLEKADISIPESLPGTVSPVAVSHVNAPTKVQEQVEKIGGGPKKEKEETTATLPPQLDIQVHAPGQIFVRGRGLDAELYGDLKIAGTTSNPQAVGAFTLRRGQMDILTRRLTFSKGEASFTGDFTPAIDFLATTTVSSTDINVGVAGPASDPVVSLSSSPEQPQDEVLALLLFGKEMGSLSPTQIAQLAAAVATLTGGSDNGPLANLRRSLGLDAIDINTNGEDGPTVGVGKYVNDNIYLGVEQGTGEGSSRVKVDIDLDKGFKVRGEVGADGDSKAGVYFEKEY